jgi:glycosyltransferase involved in cell wall biosynthesis
MHIALYYPWLYLTSGAERSILELTRHSRHQWTLYTNRFEPENTFPGLSSCDVRVLSPVSVKRSVWATAAGCLRIMTQPLPLEEHDALVVVCEGLGDLAVLRNTKRPAVCVCLTPLRVAFDPIYRARVLQDRGWISRFAVRVGAALFRAVDRLAWKRYSRIICISEEARQRAVRGNLAFPEEVEVVHPGLGFRPLRPSHQFEKYFLLPGRIMWTKNIELGIRAYKLFRQENPDLADFRLVIAGIVDRKSESYLASLRELARDTAGIEFRIHPSDRELEELYESCYTVLFTAFNEDWGIVPIEGMSFGKPVISVDRGGPRESITHGVQGYLENPEPQAFADNLASLARDPERAREMGLAGHARSQFYTWTNFAGRIDDRLDEVVMSSEDSNTRGDPRRLDTPRPEAGTDKSARATMGGLQMIGAGYFSPEGEQ